MRLHSDLHTTKTIYAAMSQAKDDGRVADHVFFYIFDDRGSRTRDRAWEIQLGTYDKLPGDKRGWKNTGQYGADSKLNGGGIYAATYDEWGWFIAELFNYDKDAVFGGYKGRDDFNSQTRNKYIL